MTRCPIDVRLLLGQATNGSGPHVVWQCRASHVGRALGHTAVIHNELDGHRDAPPDLFPVSAG